MALRVYDEVIDTEEDGERDGDELWVLLPLFLQGESDS